MVAAVVVLTLIDGRTEEVALEQSDSVGISLFSNRNDIVAATIPTGVTTIGENAFRGCTSLASVIIPEGVTTIRKYTFRRCSSLASVLMPESLRTIDCEAFRGCSSLASVTMPEGVTWIGQEAFADCSSLKSITLPKSVTVIHHGAFSGCSSLVSVHVLGSVRFILPHWNSFFKACPIETLTAFGHVLVTNTEKFGNRVKTLRYLLTEEEETALDASRPEDLGVWWSENPAAEKMPASLKAVILVRRDGSNFNPTIIEPRAQNNWRKTVDKLGLPDEITEMVVGNLGMWKRSHGYGMGSAGRLFDHTAPPREVRPGDGASWNP